MMFRSRKRAAEHAVQEAREPAAYGRQVLQEEAEAAAQEWTQQDWQDAMLQEWAEDDWRDAWMYTELAAYRFQTCLEYGEPLMGPDRRETEKWLRADLPPKERVSYLLGLYDSDPPETVYWYITEHLGVSVELAPSQAQYPL
jgi:hypothetical protein